MSGNSMQSLSNDDMLEHTSEKPLRGTTVLRRMVTSCGCREQASGRNPDIDAARPRGHHRGRAADVVQAATRSGSAVFTGLDLRLGIVAQVPEMLQRSDPGHQRKESSSTVRRWIADVARRVSIG
jgi:hypothetical protein